MNHKSFVLAWVEAYTKQLGVPTVANRLNISTATASAKANYLRKRGVNLPPMPKSRNTGQTVNELNDLIASRI